MKITDTGKTDMLKIPTNLLNAISQFVATKELREYLNGVLIEMRGGVLRLIATDGALVGVCLLPDEYPSEADFAWIMPNAMVDAVIKAKLKQVYITVGPDSVVNGASATLSVSLNGAQLSFRAIEARPVDWRRVVRLTNSTITPSNFDAALLGRIAKASKLSGSSKWGYFGLLQYGDKTGLFSIDGVNIVGAIAPLNPKVTSTFSTITLHHTVDHALNVEQFV